MKIGVVLVTFNRIEKLKVALQHYNEQSLKPEYIIVVDNCSDDGTKEFLENWEKEEASYEKEVITLDRNTGGAGGFYAGMERAVKKDTEWIWLSDDDAYPRKNAFCEISDYYEKLSQNEKSEIVSLCSAVYNEGNVHVDHRSHMEVTKFKCKMYPSTLDEYEKEAFDLDVFSYVGVAIKKEILLKAGLDEKDYFIYCDDQEHSIRLRKYGKIVCVPSSIVDHDTKPFNKNVLNWGRYYKRRNDLLMIRKNFPSRYFIFRFIRRYIGEVSILSGYSKEYREIHRAAFIDALMNKKGCHEIYRPGWNPKTKQ